MITKALSIRAPWWWFILHGGKDIENRDWPSRFRGTVYVHASKWWQRDHVRLDLEFCSKVSTHGIASPDQQIRQHGGCIVGRVDIVDCVRESKSPWFFGEYGFVLKNPVALKTPVPCKGALGFFAVPADVLVKIESGNPHHKA